jgi:hypothetical protein
MCKSTSENREIALFLCSAALGTLALCISLSFICTHTGRARFEPFDTPTEPRG